MTDLSKPNDSLVVDAPPTKKPSKLDRLQDWTDSLAHARFWFLFDLAFVAWNLLDAHDGSDWHLLVALLWVALAAYQWGQVDKAQARARKRALQKIVAEQYTYTQTREGT